MSENYQYADCKHCGKSVMEGEIHNCRQMLLAEIAGCHATMLNQGNEIIRMREALKKIAHWYDDPEERYFCDSTVTGFALEVLADRP